MTEREHIEAAQAALEAVKENLREVIKINRAAGNASGMNAAFLALSELNVWHGRQTERLLREYPSFGGAVALGPGGR